MARVYEPEPVATFALPAVSAVAWAGDTALVASSADAVVRLEVSGPAGTNQARTIWAGPAAVITDLRDPIR